ncbi:Hypothetical protein R9X50_00616200 [Acrodontium crateriforme]|uniref:DUF155 domain-containing protein n=1 Tax=Acrodontium crateriforme TaxID=150365 RepID=A0AAQ3RC07_9PEZI|nr:Hypothetical protein R9X50_00616200 [Acrodontium crateriforme]
MSVAPPRGPKRGPTVLVTDARESRPLASANRPQPTRAGTRIISVDNVLQYASSDIPSAQRRAPPGAGGRPQHHTRTPSGKHPLDPKLSGRGVPLSGGAGAAHLPARSSKTSEKLVLLPETTEEHDDEDDFEDDDEAPPRDEELARRRLAGQKGGKSEAERLSKARRNAEAQLARVTAYCTAQSFKLMATAEFVREQHGARTKLYDDCLYCVYQLPLLGGNDGYRVRSSPVMKNPGGRSILDEQIEANERREYREGWHEESDEYSVPNEVYHQNGERKNEQETAEERRDEEEEFRQESVMAQETNHDVEDDDESRRRESEGSSNLSFNNSPQPAVAADAHTVAELFIFSYGVAVLWNFTPNQEKDLLADLTFSANPHTTMPSQKSSQHMTPTPIAFSLMTRPLDESDFETEELHFQYNTSIEKPRIYNDMITLRTSDHMVKLAMSHAIAQSTKLSFFEERMHRTMSEAQYVPRRLALEGRLGMSRKEVVSLVGRLFEGRVNVNLSSNMLDTPSFFWDSEPTLHPLYQAVREYLEIKPRIQVLNERCQVFLDLAEILSDAIADVKMTRITWIIIVLIVISILVTCTEVVLRFAILAAGKKETGDSAISGFEVVKGLFSSGLQEGATEL